MFDDGWEDGTGRDPTWSRTAPGPKLAAALAGRDPLPLDGDGGFDAAERLGGWEALAAWATACQVREAADYLTSRQARVRACSRDLDDVRVATGMELAAYARVAPVTGEHRLDQAVALVQRLPETLAALEAGRVSYSHARVVLEQTAACTEEMARRVDTTLWNRPARDRTPTQLRETLRRIIARLDPDSLRRREVRARLERTVRYWSDDDGATGVLHVRMPAAEARGVYAVLDALAHTTGDHPDDEPRTPGNRRADALRDLILGGALTGQPSCDPPADDPPAGPEPEPADRPEPVIQSGGGQPTREPHHRARRHRDRSPIRKARRGRAAKGARAGCLTRRRTRARRRSATARTQSRTRTTAGTHPTTGRITSVASGAGAGAGPGDHPLAHPRRALRSPRRTRRPRPPARRHRPRPRLRQ